MKYILVVIKDKIVFLNDATLVAIMYLSPIVTYCYS